MKRNWKEIISIAASAGLSLAVFLGLLAGLGWNLLLCMGLAAASYPGFLLVLRPVKKIGRMEVEKSVMEKFFMKGFWRLARITGECKRQRARFWILY